jgi:hypothetical protein
MTACWYDWCDAEWTLLRHTEEMLGFHRLVRLVPGWPG